MRWGRTSSRPPLSLSSSSSAAAAAMAAIIAAAAVILVSVVASSSSAAAAPGGRRHPPSCPRTAPPPYHRAPSSSSSSHSPPPHRSASGTAAPPAAFLPPLLLPQLGGGGTGGGGGGGLPSSGRRSPKTKTTTTTTVAATAPSRRSRAKIPRDGSSGATSSSSPSGSDDRRTTPSTTTTSDVREIMDLLRRTYPERDDGCRDDDDDDDVGWARTRGYLYRHRASCLRACADPSPRTGGGGKEPLTVRNVESVLSFLDESLPGRPGLQARVLRRTPRILGRWGSIDSRLRPTVDFLRGLYGGMEGGGGGAGGRGGGEEEEVVGGGGGGGGGRFYEAIYRNTDLMLVRGVGYAGDGGGRGARRRDDRGGVGGDAGVSRDEGVGGSRSTTATATTGAGADRAERGATGAVEDYLRRELGAQLSLPSSAIANLKRDHPTLFQLSLDGRVRPVVEYLRSLLLSSSGTDDDGGGVSSPGGDSADPAVSTTMSYSSSSTRRNDGKARRMLTRVVTSHPTLLQLDVEANLRPTAFFLRDSCDFDDGELACVISATPGVLGLSVTRNLGPTMECIREILAAGDGGVGVGVGAFDDDGDGGEGRGGGEGGGDESKTSLRKCILKHPQILSLSLRNLRAKRDYFDDIDGVGDSSPPKDDIGWKGKARKKNKTTLAARILATAPSAYSLSLAENIIPKVEYLARLWGSDRTTSSACTENDIDGRGGRRNSLADNLREFPTILTLSKEGNIVPTISFFNMTGYVALDSNGVPRVQESSTQQPQSVIRSRYIATSLYDRLLPRWHFLLEERDRQTLKSHIHSKLEESSDASTCIVPTSAMPSSPNSSDPLPPLHLLAGANDEVFCREMKLSLTGYLKFKEKAIPRLKFASQFDRWLKTGRPIDLSDAIISREK